VNAVCAVVITSSTTWVRKLKRPSSNSNRSNFALTLPVKWLLSWWLTHLSVAVNLTNVSTSTRMKPEVLSKLFRRKLLCWLNASTQWLMSHVRILRARCTVSLVFTSLKISLLNVWNKVNNPITSTVWTWLSRPASWQFRAQASVNSLALITLELPTWLHLTSAWLMFLKNLRYLTNNGKPKTNENSKDISQN